MPEKITRVGIGVFVFKDGKFLMIKRKGSHGSGTWSLPGGHLEFNESFEDTARREVLEESGLQISNVRFGAVTNDVFTDEDKHYITVWMLSDWSSGKEILMEPDKSTDIKWVNFEELKHIKNLFLPWKNLFNSQFINEIMDSAKTSTS